MTPSQHSTGFFCTSSHWSQVGQDRPSIPTQGSSSCFCNIHLGLCRHQWGCSGSPAKQSYSSSLVLLPLHGLLGNIQVRLIKLRLFSSWATWLTELSPLNSVIPSYLPWGLYFTKTHNVWYKWYDTLIHVLTIIVTTVLSIIPQRDISVRLTK